jgi:hypothetical protein
VYAQFAAEHIKEEYDADNLHNTNYHTKLSAIYARFKAWFRDSFPGSKIPELPIVRSEFNTRWDQMRHGGWYGIKLVSEDDVELGSALGGRSKEEIEKSRKSEPKMTPKEQMEEFMEVATYNVKDRKDNDKKGKSTNSDLKSEPRPSPRVTIPTKSKLAFDNSILEQARPDKDGIAVSIW